MAMNRKRTRGGGRGPMRKMLLNKRGGGVLRQRGMFAIIQVKRMLSSIYEKNH